MNEQLIMARLKELRKENQLTQLQLGKLLNISQDTISLWEKGKSLPGVEYIVALAKLYDVTTDYLLGLKDF